MSKNTTTIPAEQNPILEPILVGSILGPLAYNCLASGKEQQLDDLPVFNFLLIIYSS